MKSNFDKMKYKTRTEIIEAYQHFEKDPRNIPEWLHCWGLISPEWYCGLQKHRLWVMKDDTSWVVVPDGDYIVKSGSQVKHFSKEEFESRYEEYDESKNTPIEVAEECDAKVKKPLTIEDLTLAQKRVAKGGFCGEFHMPRGSGKSTACFVGAVDSCLDKRKCPVKVAIFANSIYPYGKMIESLSDIPGVWIEKSPRGFRVKFGSTGSTLIISKQDNCELMDSNGRFVKPNQLAFEYDDIYFDEWSLRSIQYVFKSNKSASDILSNFAKNKWVVVNTPEPIDWADE